MEKSFIGIRNSLTNRVEEKKNISGKTQRDRTKMYLINETSRLRKYNTP